MITRAFLTLALCLVLASPSWAAVGFGTISTLGSGTTSVAAQAYPASVADGDLLILCVASKYPVTSLPSTPSGWTDPSNNNGADDGTGDPGTGVNDRGSAEMTLFYRVVSGGCCTSGTFAITDTLGNSMASYIVRYTNATGSWLVASAAGADNTYGANWSAGITSDPGITSGDMVVACSARNIGSVANASAESISASGATFTTHTERGDNGTSFGDNVGIVISDHTVTAGTSSGNATYTFTSGSSSLGGTVILRIREDNAAPATAIQSSQGWLGAIQ